MKNLKNDFDRLDRYNEQIGDFFDLYYEQSGIDPLERLSSIGKTVDDILEEMLNGKTISEIMNSWF